MSVTIALSATTATDRQGLQAILSAYAGETVTLSEPGFGDTTGRLSVGDYAPNHFDTDGFTVTVTDGQNFVATGVWGDDSCGTLRNGVRITVG